MFIEETGQLAKLKASSVAAGLMALIFAAPLQLPDWLASWSAPMLAITALLCFGMAMLVAIAGYGACRCPNCKLRLVWWAASTKPIGTVFPTILQLEECPRCRYSPNASADVRKPR